MVLDLTDAFDFDAVLRLVLAGRFCSDNDPEHKYCPLIEESRIKFPSGSVMRDGRFKGVERLFKHLKRELDRPAAEGAAGFPAACPTGRSLRALRRARLKERMLAKRS